MATFMGPAPYVRLRRLPGDPRLYITDHSTTAGYLAQSEVQYTSGDLPYLVLELEEHQHDLYGAGIDARREQIRANRILLADVHALADTVRPAEHPYHQILNTLDRLRPLLSDAVPPPCGHEDVIETPELGNPATPGVCMWCPVPLVRRDDAWVPA
jgi:hypothetical protein